VRWKIKIRHKSERQRKEKRKVAERDKHEKSEKNKRLNEWRKETEKNTFADVVNIGAVWA
jgi:hypothetical protein